MMKKKLTRLLEDLQKPQEMLGELEKRMLTMDEQQQEIKEFFQERRGDNEQTDDVLIIGIKI